MVLAILDFRILASGIGRFGLSSRAGGGVFGGVGPAWMGGFLRFEGALMVAMLTR